ncbi:SpoIIE family protein phosphatase [Streptomyces ficellus]|uniref:protein-serine/threonine phosphatase n=1 Tax=Streptomyces ficellus TaxID=1977088 RepID=A0A6I6FQP4_9ACTN|nr:SpoIIE family protein phosphatase [Streptomyces ficellus]QGV78956.1 GAF domain-containing protein [Streptomyces ficellus]
MDDHGEQRPPDGGVRPEILASWRRSESLGIGTEGAALPVEDDLDPDSRLVRAAAPVLDRLCERFAGLPVTVALADARANLVDRRGDPAGLELMDAASLVPGANVDERYMGTSSVSMVLSTRAPFVVVGEEHFLHNLKELTCMAAPVRDPVGGTVLGAVNLSVPKELAEPGMALALQDATDRIAERLLDLSAARERNLMSSFLRARERGGHARLHLGSGELAPLGAAPPRLAGAERLALLESAIDLIAAPSGDDGGRAFAEVPLAGGRVATLRRRELRHGDAEGAAVEVSFADTGTTGGGDGGGGRTVGAAAATAPDGRAVPLLHRAAVGGPAEPDTPTGAGEPGEAAGADAASGTDAPGDPTDAWLLLVGEPGVGRLAAEARGRLSLLNEAGVRVGTTLDMRRTAQELAEIAVPRFADLVVVDLVEGALAGEEPPASPLGPGAVLRRVAAWPDEDARDAGGARGARGAGAEGAAFVDGTVTHPPGTPQARCLATGRPVTDSVVTDALTGPEAAAGHPVDLLGEGVHSYLGAPLCSRGAVLGLAGFYRRGRNRPYEHDDLTLAGELAARTAISLDNARHYSREHQASLTLQRSLLPRDTPRLTAADLAFRYLPADATAGVGGDWFDAIPLSGMRVALVVGDVAGHGLQAAATMGRLRTAVRTLAAMDLPPEEVLTHLDDLVSRTSDDPATGATCLYAVYDPVSCRCTAARAGHPPPALLTPGGRARLLDLPAGPPLGVGDLGPYESVGVDLPEGSLLALWTDGLLKEIRGYGGTDTEARTALFLASLTGPEPSLERICDRVTGALLPDGPHDDVALLLARVRALPEDRVASWELPSDPAVVARARELTHHQLARWGLAELDFSTGLVVSELVTNAVRYGGRGPIGLRLLRDGSLFCEVSDRSNTSPRIRRAATTEEGGRGLFLVARFTRSWGARFTPGGKVVWAEQVPHGGPPAAEPDEQTLLSMYDDLA